jgi:glycerol-3-phosphate acyltransferase PlsY
MIAVAGALVAAYLVGGIPWSLLVVRWVKGTDLRRVGSGNLGATNVYRVLGAGGAIAVLLLDIAKGAVAPLVIAPWAASRGAPLDAATLSLLAGLAAIVGHIFPPYLRWRGGKGIATTAGVFAALEPRAFLIAFAAFVVVLLATRGIVSVASLVAATVLPVAVGTLGTAPGPAAIAHTGAAALLAVLIWIKHAGNLARLRRGEERSLFRRNPGRPAP